MTQSNYRKDLEDSRLLFRTFCDGLMYGMFFYHGENLHRVASIEGLEETINGVYPIKECKPCLRSMSSMTEEERIEYRQKQTNYEFGYFDTYDSIDWLNAHHFDYRNLIFKGLALEAPEEMYNT